MSSAIKPMPGLYVYCIRAHGVNSGKMKGIDFGEKIRAVPFKDIEALASEIDLSQFNEKNITHKLHADQKWAEKNIRCHHNVIAAAYKNNTVIPMKFGTIFKTKISLTEMLQTHYRKFKRLLAKLSNKQEWGVKINLEQEKFAAYLKQENKEVKKLEQKKSALPAGKQWYADKKIEESVAAQFEEEVENQLQTIVKRLEDCCEQIVFGNLLPKETMAAGKENIFNAACLIDNNKLDYFKKLSQEMQKEYDQIGAALVTTGPWPPYNFVQLDEKN